ncbi:hypothetical protein VDGL01_10308 [Verticillium dahliae]
MPKVVGQLALTSFKFLQPQPSNCSPIKDNNPPDHSPAIPVEQPTSIQFPSHFEHRYRRAPPSSTPCFDIPPRHGRHDSTCDKSPRLGDEATSAS